MRRRHLSEAELTEYVDGELHPRRAADAEAHIRHCESCAALAAGLRSAAAAAGSLRSVAVPGDLRARVARRLAQDLAAQITCRQAAPLIHQHLDGCLSPKAELELQGHLRSCARCRADLAALASAARLVRSLPALEAPARVREVVSAAQRLRTLRFPRIARWRPALAAAIAAAAVGVLVLLRPVGDQAPPSGPIRMAEPEAVSAPAATEVASLTDTAAEGQPGGTPEQPVEPTTPEAGPTRRAEKPMPRPPVPMTVVCAAKGPAPARTTPQSPEPCRHSAWWPTPRLTALRDAGRWSSRESVSPPCTRSPCGRGCRASRPSEVASKASLQHSPWSPPLRPVTGPRRSVASEHRRHFPRECGDWSESVLRSSSPSSSSRRPSQIARIPRVV
jgi:anti-sigma factor RsiW